MLPYEEFKKAVRHRESGDNYECVNRWGYLGAYQFGMARLCDLGLARRIKGAKGMSNSAFEFVDPITQQEFLSNPKLQDTCFDRHVGDLKRRLSYSYTGQNMSGAIAAAHLMGCQSFMEYWHYGKDKSDGLGTRISDYFKKFEGYEIP